jgi:hypothetical protein
MLGTAFKCTNAVAAPNRNVKEESTGMLHVPIVPDNREKGCACNNWTLLQFCLQRGAAHKGIT